jgi:hypothetical protein
LDFDATNDGRSSENQQHVHWGRRAASHRMPNNGVHPSFQSVQRVDAPSTKPASAPAYEYRKEYAERVVAPAFDNVSAARSHVYSVNDAAGALGVRTSEFAKSSSGATSGAVGARHGSVSITDLHRAAQLLSNLET